MGFTEQLMTGLAQHLATAGLGVWKPGTAYTADEVGIVLGEPSQDPPAVIALAHYNASDHPALSDSVESIQVRCRSANDDPAQANDLADGVFELLQGLWSQTINGVTIGYARRRSSLPLGTDDNGRYERSDNYDLAVHRPSTHRE